MKLVKKTHIFLIALLMLCCYANIVLPKSTSDKIKDTIDKFSDSLKSGIDKLGDDFVAVQRYLDNYHWKGIIQGKATSGVVTLTDLRFNEHHRSVVVKPGEWIDADVICTMDSAAASPIEIYRVVIGYQAIGAQTVIYNQLGRTSEKKFVQFRLQAPGEPGVYQVRFRTVNTVLESIALTEWQDENGNEPDATTTVGVVVVRG